MNANELTRLRHYYDKLDATHGSLICLSDDERDELRHILRHRYNESASPTWLRRMFAVMLVVFVIVLTLYCPLELTRVITLWANDYYPTAFPLPQVRELVYIWSNYALAMATVCGLVYLTIWRGGKS